MAARPWWQATQRSPPKRRASRDMLGYPDLALKGKITFGVSAAQENKIDIDRTRPA